MRSLALLLALFLPTAASAADNVTLITGPKTGTYYAFGKDIATLAQSKKINVDVKESEGSVDNIRRIEATGGVKLGIVQSDVLGFLSRSQSAESRQVVSHLRVIYPFYEEEIHVLARDGITDFKDLQGKKVAVGEEGSGHMLTAVNLFAIEQIVPSEMEKVSPEEGVVAVLKGDIDAVILVGGKPVRLFKNMEDLTKPENQKFSLLLQHVHFLPLNSAKFYNEYEPTEITPADYSFVKSTVPTIAVQAVLVSYEKSPAKKQKTKKGQKPKDERCDTLRKFASLVKTGLPTLKQTGHPKWREVNLTGDVIGWRKDSCLSVAR